ncbi:hypothetical protein TVAG_159870 [Trichomonas vaginalis G3]|uniref:Inner centromere protein ARK-binding domain-containing protein n=1 Tax=Trichomonas vaginalis (strain ATCC PRA-98 / G3) TaxID=412133 RepID=A2DUS9_TRIV3|nr:inner centromere protein, ARK binding region-containing protein [Trichomonas vaginalis G3]EAY15814.1 hypothetical protein TVAG_159870 [Trichomonas vaginalis G3]KAI5525015.1 inner centromere protein, ARK binding region-containing protein [Trichomonas vaginalis G3]|eukprot:XP_001328037.1 hypothetical protein [Trichomonas vaginalis G3]
MKSSVEAEVDAQINWMQSLLNLSAPMSSQPRSTDKYHSQIDDLLSSIEATQAAPQFTSPTKVHFELSCENDQEVDSSPLSEESSPKEASQYRISDPLSSDDEDDDDSEEFYVDDAEEIRGKEVPSWARAQNLLQELEKQKKVDPDMIFVGFQKSCDLNTMFEKKKKTFKVRGDSGYWATDSVTPDEEVKYKKALGYA